MDKFYIIGIRSNPQLGSYLSKAVVAKPKVNKASITAKFEEYGSQTSIKFYLHAGQDGCHYQKSSTSCVYGSYSYYGFEDKAKAITYLQTWLSASGSSPARAKEAIARFEAA